MSSREILHRRGVSVGEGVLPSLGTPMAGEMSQVLHVDFSKFTYLNFVFLGTRLPRKEGCWRAQSGAQESPLGRLPSGWKSEHCSRGLATTLGVEWSLPDWTSASPPRSMCFSFLPVLAALPRATNLAWEKEGRAEPLLGKGGSQPCSQYGPT